MFKRNVWITNTNFSPVYVYGCEFFIFIVKLGLSGERYGKIEILSPFNIKTWRHHQISIIALRWRHQKYELCKKYIVRNNSINTMLLIPSVIKSCNSVKQKKKIYHKWSLQKNIKLKVIIAEKLKIQLWIKHKLRSYK